MDLVYMLLDRVLMFVVTLQSQSSAEAASEF